MKITKINTDLTQYPVPAPEKLGLDSAEAHQQELTLGDLSGNLLLLMWVLITAGLAEMTQENYSDLVKLQQAINEGHEASFAKDKNGIRKTLGSTPKKQGIPYIAVDQVAGLTDEQHQTWATILTKTTFIDKNILLRLEGDEVADRLGTDSAMIDALDKMATQMLPFKIIASNHLHLLVQYFLSKKSKTDEDEDEEENFDDLAFNGQGVSLLHMMASVKNGTIDNPTLRKKIANVYSTRLKLIDYSFGSSHTDITLYAHAPFDLQSIVNAATQLNVPIPTLFHTANDVARFIDHINEAFKKSYVDIYFSGKCEEEMPVLSKEADLYSTATHPIGGLLWMKYYQDVTGRDVPACFQKMTVTLVHGHTNDPEIKQMHNRSSLNAESNQPMNHYSFPVAAITHKLENKFRNTDSPVALTAEILPASPFLPAYKNKILEGLRNAEGGNSSPTGLNSPSPTPFESMTKFQ